MRDRVSPPDFHPRIYLCFFGDVQMTLANIPQDECFGLFRRAITNFGIGYSFNQVGFRTF